MMEKSVDLSWNGIHLLAIVEVEERRTPCKKFTVATQTFVITFPVNFLLINYKTSFHSFHHIKIFYME